MSRVRIQSAEPRWFRRAVIVFSLPFLPIMIVCIGAHRGIWALAEETWWSLVDAWRRP